MVREDQSRKQEGKSSWTVEGAEARRYVSRAVSEVASLVRSTYGPYGSHKLIVTADLTDQNVTVTGDGTRVLEAIEDGDGFIDPLAAILVDSVDSLQRGVGDGTTSAILLTDALMSHGLSLIEQGIPPTTVVFGYMMAAERAGQTLDSLVRACSSTDRELLKNIAATSITVDVAERQRSAYARTAAEIVQRLDATREEPWLNTNNVKIVTRTGEWDQRIQRGVVVVRRPVDADNIEAEKSMALFRDPILTTPVEPATVAIVEGDIDFERTATSLGRNKGATLNSVEDYKTYSSQLTARRAQAARNLADLGVDVLVSQSRVDDAVFEVFANQGIHVVDGVKTPLSDVYRVARATNGSVASNLEDITPDQLGVAERIVERREGAETWTTINGTTEEMYTVILSSPQDTSANLHRQTIEKAVEITARSVMDKQIVPGAGAAPLVIVAELRTEAPTVAGREQLAIEAFANALDDLLFVLVENMGYDPIDILTTLRSAHNSGGFPYGCVGINSETGTPIDVWEHGIVEPRRVLSQAIETALTTVSEFLTIDSILASGVDWDSFIPSTEHL